MSKMIENIWSDMHEHFIECFILLVMWVVPMTTPLAFAATCCWCYNAWTRD